MATKYPCAIHVRFPPSRMRNPKPGSSSSKNSLSREPEGSDSPLTDAWVSFMN